MKFLAPVILVLSSACSLDQRPGQSSSPSADPAASAPLILAPEHSRTVSPTTQLDIGVVSLGFSNSTCTATIISKRGHILTARHCVESVLADANMQPGYESSFILNEEAVSDSIWKYPYSEKIKTHLQVPFGLDDKVEYGKIVAIGPGGLYPRFDAELADKTEREKHRLLEEQGFSSGGDFAILEVPALKDRTCKKVTKSLPALGQSIHGISFPCYKREDDSWPQKRVGKSEVYTQTAGAELEGLWLPHGSIVVGMQAESCNSGSPLLNENGDVVAVLHTVLTNDGAGLILGLTVSRIFDFVPEQTRSEILQLNEKCEVSH
jgi:Trypsin-like peptidase domain